MIKKILLSIIGTILFVLGFFLLKQDFVPFLQWWLVIAILGIIFMPITSLIFSSFDDKGYLFSKTIGIAVSGYLMWLLSSLHILKFRPLACYLAVVIGVILNLGVAYHQRKKDKGSRMRLEEEDKGVFLDRILTEELIFLGLFLVFSYIRGFKPEAFGTEKFMDYGFMTSMMRSDYMPPQDFWFSGTNLNYYYVGQYLATFLTKLSFVEVSVGYNLMLMMVGAFSFVLPFSLGANVMLQYSIKQGKPNRILGNLSGIISGAAVCIAGNMHYPVYRYLEPWIRTFFGMEEGTYRYWFPDATRFIGYHPETNDKTIHEFPSYSFVLGDLHAHVINIMFVLTVLGILYALMLTKKKENMDQRTLWMEVFHPAHVLLGFFIGLFRTTNFWDFPIYYVVSGAVILFSNMVVYNFKGKAYWVTALQGIFIIGMAEIISLPFTLTFDKISSNIRIVSSQTPLNQLIILWGLPIVVVLSFFVFRLSDFMGRAKENKGEEKKLGILRFMENLTPSDLFIITIGFCAMGLILLPELIYVEDIYSGDYKRANTMFKLTYQAFIMFGICLGYILLVLLKYAKTMKQRKYAIIGLFLFGTTLLYPINAVDAWYGNIFDRKGYQGLDATAFMEQNMPEDHLATKWLNENVSGMPVVLEANGDSYTSYQRVSVMTGLPTVLGWRTHEWLWKSDPTRLDERAEDIKTIYTSEDRTEVRDLIETYNISYIYVGKLEQQKFEVHHDLLKRLGEMVYYISGEGKNETYIIQIQR